ncbi:hypothetical protein TCAL_11087 [Tigriopus californicus]|uniref:Uncharacterized protein n=1 Tax=Tigriopus californicus TaxID=6832 RepID=A0A553P7L7_TIGCA|nr:hypothetical protein TCAL_11087 [Tigriopus californicus]
MILRVGRSDSLGLGPALLLVGVLSVTTAQDQSESLLDTTLFDVGSESVPGIDDQATPIQDKKVLPTSKGKKMSINPWMMTWRSVLADALKSNQKDVSKATTVTRSQSTTSNTEPTISVAFAEKLIGERRSANPQSFNDVFQVDTTAFPQLVSPTKFDELLQSPKVNFKGQVGSVQKVKQAQSEGPMDEARERIKEEKKQTRVPMRANKFKEQRPFTRTQLNTETTEGTPFEFPETTFNPGPTLMDLAREEIKASLAPSQASSRIIKTTTSTTPTPLANEPITISKPRPTPMDLARAEIRTGLDSEPITFRSASFAPSSIPSSPSAPTPLDLARDEIRTDLNADPVTSRSVFSSVPSTASPPPPPAPTPMDLARDEIRTALKPDPITFRPMTFVPPAIPSSTASPSMPTPMDLARAKIRTGLDVDPVTSRPVIFSAPSTSSSPPAPTPMDLVRQDIRADLIDKLQDPVGFTTFRNDDTTLDLDFQEETTTARTIGAMEQARDSIRNNLSTVPTTTTTTTTVPTTPRTESPMATARNLIRNQMTTTTDLPAISSTSSFFEAEEVTETESPLDRMLQARDRLRLLMGGASPSTTENTPMDDARDEIRAQLQTRTDPILKASDTVQPDVGEGLLPPGLSDDPMISVTVRGHPKDIPRPAITLEPILDMPSTTSVPSVFIDGNDFEIEISSTNEPFRVTTEPQTTISPTRSEVLELLETHTESQVGNFNVLNTPSQMQGTLLKLIQKNQDSQEQALLVQSEEEFNNFAAPNGKQNPLLRLLQPGSQGLVDVDSNFSDFTPPALGVTHEELQSPPQEDLKDPLEKPLFPPRKTFSNFVPPSRKQNPLLKRLRGNQNLVNTRKTFSDFKPPSSKQDILLKPLKENDPGNSEDVPRRTFSDFKPPSSKQDTLLKPLKENDPGNSEDVPRRTFSDFKPPSSKQDTLLKPLKENDPGNSEDVPRRTFSDFKPPSRRQNPLLKRLRAGHRARYQGLKVPGRKQDLLLRTLKGKQNQKIEGLEVPKETETEHSDQDSEVISGASLGGTKSEPLVSKDDGTFFKNSLTPNHNQQIVGLNPPNVKQDLLLRPLQANQNSDLALDVPSRDPLSRPLAGDQSDPVRLNIPRLKQDLLLRPLTPNQASNHELDPPSLKQDLLLGPLQRGQTGSNHDLSLPPLKQDLLLKPLQGGQQDDFDLEAPSRDPLAQPLAGDQSEPFQLTVPSSKQNPLLRPLTPNQASNHDLKLPPHKQDLLLRPLQSGQTGSNHNLEVPSIKQSTLLKQLTPNHSSILDLDPPSVKQNPFLRPLQSQVDQKIPDLDPPGLVKSEKLQRPPKNPLEQPLNPMNTFDEDILELPEIRNNPLIRIIKFDRRAKTKPNARQGSYMRLPIFRQVALVPKKFASNFADLPESAQRKLKEIFDEKAPSSFKYEDLAGKVKEDLEEEVFANFESTTAAPKIISSTFSTIFPKAFPSTTTASSSSSSTSGPRFRLRMPKNKFAILSVDRPTDEVTFQRESSTLHSTQVTPTEPPTTPPPLLIPTEADDLVTEQIVPDITTFTNLETSTSSSPTPSDSTTFPGTPDKDFGSEVRKVTKMLQQTGFDMDRGRNRQMIQMLKDKAETSGSSENEISGNIEMVNKLIAMVKKVQKDNAEVEQFLDDIKNNKELERVVSTPAALTFDDVDDAFLLTKIRNHSGPKTDAKDGLVAPDFEQRKVNFLLQKIRAHNGSKSVDHDGLTPPANEDLSQEEISFLLKKIQGHSGSHDDFGDILADEDHAFLQTTTEKLINDFLVRKVKNHKGQRQDPQSGLSPPTSEETFTIPSRFTPEVSTAKAIVKSFLQKKIKANAGSHVHGDFGEYLNLPEGPSTDQAIETEFLLNKIREHDNSNHHDDFGDQLEPPSGSKSEKLTESEETEFLLQKIRNHVGTHTDFKDSLKVPRLHIPTTKAPIVVTTTQVTPEELFLLQKVRGHKGSRRDPTNGLQIPIRHLGQPTPIPPVKSTTERLEFLIQKINANNDVRDDFGDALQFPINKLEASTDTPHSVSSTPPTTEEDSDSEIDFLLQKINLHDGIRQDFAEVLQAPSTGSDIKSEKIQRDPFLIEKIKNHSGDKDDFGNVLNVPNRDEHLIQKIRKHQGTRDENTDGLSVPKAQDDAVIEPLLLKKIRTHQGSKFDQVEGLRVPIDDSEVDFLLQKIRNNQGNRETFGDILKAPQIDPFLIQKINQHSGKTNDDTDGLTIPHKETSTEDDAFLIQKIKSSLGPKLDPTTGLQLPINDEEVEFLFNKIKSHQGDRETFQELLKLSDVPQRDPFLIQKINSHQGTQSDFSESLTAPKQDAFLTQKIKQHQGQREDFGAHLSVPSTTTEGSFLHQKIKSHEGSRPEFGSVLEAPEHGTLPSVPRSSTSTPLSVMSEIGNFEQKLRTSDTREEIEDHIMDMIVSKPDVVVETFTSIFQTTDQAQKLEQKAKLTEMVENDPLSVTVAFSDLMSKQNEILKEDIFTPKVPHKYEDPPEEVEGQLLRITMPESVTKTPRLPEDILSSMIEIIQAGDLEDRNIVDQMIDEGKLEMKDLLKTPKEPQNNLKNKEREHVSPQRMKEMLMKEGDKRPMIYRDQKHQMIEVNINDPSHDFEMVNAENPRLITPINAELSQHDEDIEEEQPFNGVEKDIDVMKSMITLFKHGMIDKSELKEMMSFLGEEDMEIPEVREEDNMSAQEQETTTTTTTTTTPPPMMNYHQTTTPPPVMNYDHERPVARPQTPKKDKPSESSGTSYSYINFPKLSRPEEIPDFPPKPELLQNRPQSLFKEPLVDPHPFAQPQVPKHKPAIRPPPPPPPRPTPEPFVRVNGQPDRPKSVSYSHIEMPAVHRPRVPLTGERAPQPTFKPRIPLPTRPTFPPFQLTRKPVLLDNFEREPLIPSSHLRPRPSPVPLFTMNQYPGHQDRPPVSDGKPRQFEDKARIVQGFSDTFTNGELKQSFEDAFSNVDISMHDFGREEEPENYGGSYYEYEEEEESDPEYARPNYAGFDDHEDHPHPMREIEFGSDEFEDQKSFVSHLIDDPHSGSQEPREIDGFGFDGVTKLKESVDEPFGHAFDSPRGVEFAALPDQPNHPPSEEDLSRRSFDVGPDPGQEDVKEIDLAALSGVLTGNPEVDRNIGNIWVQFNQNSS